MERSPILSPTTLQTKNIATSKRVKDKKIWENRKNTPHVFSLILFHPFTRTLYSLLFNNLTIISFLFLTLLETNNTSIYYFKSWAEALFTFQCCVAEECVWLPWGTQQTQTLFIHFSSALFTDGKHRNCLNFTPVTLKYFLSLLIFLCLQPPPPPFLFLIPATLHLCNLAPSKLCYFYTRAGEQSERAGEWRRCRFPGFFRAPSSNLAHLPPSASL